MYSDLPSPADGPQSAPSSNSATLQDVLGERSFQRPIMPFASVWERYADAGLQPVPVLDTPPKGYHRWSAAQAEQWAEDGERWAYAQTALTVGDGFVVLDDDYDEKTAALEAQLGLRPRSLYSTSRGSGAARRKTMFRVPTGSLFVGEYDGGEVIDSRHRFMFVCPTVNRKTGEVEQWYGPDDQPLERFPTADDVLSMVAELPAEWVEHLSRGARGKAAEGPYNGPTEFQSGELSQQVQRVAERHPDTSRYPAANAALMSLAWVAVRYPNAEGIETLRAQTVASYVNRTTTRTSPPERQARMDKSWKSALARQSEDYAGEWAAADAEFGTVQVQWWRRYTPTASKLTHEYTALERAMMGDPSGYAEERAQRAGEAVSSSWTRADLTDVLDPNYRPDPPTVGKRSDGRALFFAGKVNEIHGTDGSGKTLVMCGIVTETLLGGGKVLYIDHEEDASVIVSRLRLFGVPVEVIREHLHYVHPEGRPTPAEMEALILEGFALVVIDTVNESVATLTGGDSSSTDDMTRWHALIRPFARSGACVIVVDHVTKDSGNPLFPIGSQAKRAGYKGLVYLVEEPKDGGLVEGGRGYLKLRLAKSNSGGLGIKRGALAAEFHLDTSGQVAQWEFLAPDSSRQLAEMSAEIENDRERIALALTDAGGSVDSKSDLWTSLGLQKNAADWAKNALAMMIQDGSITEGKGRNGGSKLTLRSNIAPSPEADAENALWSNNTTPAPTITPSPVIGLGEGEGGQSESTDLPERHSGKVSEGREGLPHSIFRATDAELEALLDD